MVQDTRENGENFDEVVVTFGLTGKGKSSFLNFLYGKELSAALRDGIYVIDGEDLPLAIGHGESKTDVPEFVKIDKRIFIELPGFLDNRGLDYDTVAHYAVYRAFSTFNAELSNKKTKAMLCVSEDMLADPRALLLNSLTTSLGGLFGEGIGESANSCLTVVTQRDPEKQDPSVW